MNGRLGGRRRVVLGRGTLDGEFGGGLVGLVVGVVEVEDAGLLVEGTDDVCTTRLTNEVDSAIGLHVEGWNPANESREVSEGVVVLCVEVDHADFVLLWVLPRTRDVRRHERDPCGLHACVVPTGLVRGAFLARVERGARVVGLHVLVGGPGDIRGHDVRVVHRVGVRHGARVLGRGVTPSQSRQDHRANRGEEESKHTLLHHVAPPLVLPLSNKTSFSHI